MRAAAMPVAQVAGPFRCVDSSAPSSSGQLHNKTNCHNASGCLATQAARVHRRPKRTDVGWLSNQRLGSNASAESLNNVAHNGNRVKNVRAVMVPVRPRETSLGDPGNGASLRAIEVWSALGASGAGSVNARKYGTIIQTATEDIDAAEARAGFRAASVSEFDPVIYLAASPDNHLRSLTVLEGLALYTDPNFKVLAASYPYFAKRLLTDQNPYLRNALDELLFKDGTFRWNRLENLLTQCCKDSDCQANDVVQPMVELLLAQEGDELQLLIEGEVVRVTEALIIGTAIQTLKPSPCSSACIPSTNSGQSS